MTNTSDIPESTLPYPPIHKDKEFVVLTDWDGTITNHDSNDYMIDNLGFGKEKRREGHMKVLTGEKSFRDAFREGLGSVVANGHTFDECKEILKKSITLDESFREFYYWCKANDVPVIVVSSGMAPLIRAVLSKHIGDKEASKIEIISNDVDVQPGGKWRIKYRHPSSQYGHDKSRAILPYRELPDPPTLFFFGDGISDISAAKHADVLFVKQKGGGENDLATYCTGLGIRHILFTDFLKALPVVESIVNGEMSVDEALTIGKA